MMILAGRLASAAQVGSAFPQTRANDPASLTGIASGGHTFLRRYVVTRVRAIDILRGRWRLGRLVRRVTVADFRLGRIFRTRPLMNSPGQTESI